LAKHKTRKGIGEPKRPAEAEASKREHQLRKAEHKRLRQTQEQLRLRQEQEFESRAEAAKKKVDSEKERNKRKRKPVDELLNMLNLTGVRNRALRSPSDYASRSYNLDRQVDGLIEHMFVEYDTPRFLYKCLKLEHKNVPFTDTFKRWFITIAQGGSFRKSVQDLMTSKEASVILNGTGDEPIFRYVWWAKLKAAGVPDYTIDKVIEKLFHEKAVEKMSPRHLEVIAFFGKYHNVLGREELAEVLDFLAWKLARDPEWSLKGRTASSLIKLSNEWHVLIQKAKLGGEVVWLGLGLMDWEHDERDLIYTVRELRNNRELMNEGRKQQHCVYSYVQRCVFGQSYIFSFRCYTKGPIVKMSDGTEIQTKGEELGRVTIEVNKQRAIVQVKARGNAAPQPEHRVFIRMWAGAYGLTGRPS
jgi:hypothetical protein